MSVGFGTEYSGGVLPVRRVSRKRRTPEHTWYVSAIPYAIQPVCIAPVLAGETLKHASWQARVVSDPIKNPLIGAHHEYYWFYVKLRDIAHLSTFDNDTTGALIEQLLMNPDADVSSLKSSVSDVMWYRDAETQIPWTKLCLQLIVEKYFRDEGEDINLSEGGFADTGASGRWFWLAQLARNNALHSAVVNAEYDAPTDAGLTIGGDGLFTMKEFEEKWRMWQLETRYGRTDLTFDDYLAAQGVGTPRAAQDDGTPELLRFVKQFSYPANTVLSGSVNSAYSWSFEENMKKDRFFREPGFIFGVTITRPKFYLKNQTSAMAHFMDNMRSWLPADLRDDAYSSMKKFLAGEGPVPGSTTDYWVDIADLLVHGDQFVNEALSTTAANGAALPTATLQKRYPSLADIASLFSVGTVRTIRQDGIARFEILGTVEDRTART